MGSRYGGMDAVFVAQHKFRLRRYGECTAICDQILNKHPLDQAVWLLKTKSLTKQDYIDDTDMEEEGVAELMMDENAMAQAPRPGTSLRRPMTGSGSTSGVNPSMRPMTASGRPLTGFARPGTGSTTATSIEKAFEGSRPGTSRPVSVSGRYMRLGTQSMLSGDAKFINPDRIDVNKYARKPALAKALCDYLIYCERNPKKAMELAAACTKFAEFRDWWWKARLGKCYYQLGMLRDAEKQFRSSLRDQEMIVSFLELCKIFIRLDQPNAALETYARAADRFPGETSLLLGVARIYDGLNDLEKGIEVYKRVLIYDACNVEAIACLAGHHFYSDQPELALRLYRRLLQVGVKCTEIYNNIGLCCFYSGQYDLTLTCFEKALALANDDNMADVWYNIGQLAIGIGDLNLGFQAFKIAVSISPKHAESFNNLGILELRKPQPNIEQARSNFEIASRLAPHMFEPFFNGGLLAFKLGDCQDSYQLAQRSLDIFADHTDSQELVKQLKKHFTML